MTVLSKERSCYLLSHTPWSLEFTRGMSSGSSHSASHCMVLGLNWYPRVSQPVMMSHVNLDCPLQNFCNMKGRLSKYNVHKLHQRYILKKGGRKHGALRPQKPLRLIKDGEVGGSGFFVIFLSGTYLLLCHHQNDSALRWAAV